MGHHHLYPHPHPRSNFKQVETHPVNIQVKRGPWVFAVVVILCVSFSFVSEWLRKSI